MRIDQREPDQLRPVKITTDYLLTAEGSALIEVGNTRVLCAASIEETVPGFLRGHRQRMGDGRVFHAAARHRDAHPARSFQGPRVGPHHGNPAADRPLAALAWWI